jgi:hypothetical protein
LHLFRWSWAPPEITGTQRQNFKYVQIDGIAIGLANAASPFLSVFLARLGATNLQVSLLTSMPGATGILLAIFIGHFLQKRRNIVPWFSASRLAVVSSYAATGLVPFVLPRAYVVPAILAILAVATLPQTSLAVCFSVVMNAVAGPSYRYDLMSRRWSILGLATAISVALVGEVLDAIRFPLNYQVVFLALSVGGLLSYYFSSRISLPDQVPPPATAETGVHGYLKLIRSSPSFLDFIARRFVFQFGMLLVIPLFTLYYVRSVQADDAWIGYINMAQTLTLLVGYFLWPRQSRKRGSRFVLLVTTLGLSLYPLLVAATYQVVLITLFAALSGIFQAGIDLVFFDELMKTVPVEYSATFVSFSQSLTYLATVIAPLAGAWLSNQLGLQWALVIGAAIRMAGFALFALQPKPVLEVDTALVIEN